MSFWIVLWKSVFVVCVSAFALMSVWVTVQGFRDIQSLLKMLRDEQAGEDSGA